MDAATAKMLPLMGVTPIAGNHCLIMMMTPMAESMPCTAADGKKSPSFPTLNNPKSAMMAPAITMAPSAWV
ncbi:MAG: Uncharacterised protein [Cryomorphaceae bacterium]|nr:MAG: Uncharacterised protein [Cryomorphaceae bacterium]